MIGSAVVVDTERTDDAIQTDHKSTIQSVVVLRGIAALGVAITHIQKHLDFHVNRWFDYIMYSGQQGVVVFFVISGFILPYALYKNNYTINNFFSFLLRRSVRIDPAYWVSIAVYFAAATLPLSLLTFKGLIAHVFYAVPFVHGVNWYSGIYWTLSIEFQFYILLGLSFPYLIRLNNYLVCFLLIAVSIIGMYLPYQLFITDKLYLFVFGYVTFLAYSKKINMLWAYVILTGFCLFLIGHVSITNGLMPLTASLIILLYKRTLKLPVMIFLGNISYSLYLVHQPAMLFFQQYLSFGVKNNLILFSGSLLFAVAFAYVFFKLIEQPSIRLSKRVSWKSKKQIVHSQV